MSITVFIRYQLDPFKRVPHEGTNNIAFALISFESLAAYEAYRARCVPTATASLISISPRNINSSWWKNGRSCERS